MSRPSARGELIQRSEDIISDVEGIIARLKDLEEYAVFKKRPHIHFRQMQIDLRSSVNLFTRIHDKYQVRSKKV